MAYNRELLRVMRHKRIRKKVSGTPGRPRMCIKRSLKHTYAQLVDDVTGKTLLTVSTLSKELKGYKQTSFSLKAFIIHPFSAASQRINYHFIGTFTPKRTAY